MLDHIDNIFLNQIISPVDFFLRKCVFVSCGQRVTRCTTVCRSVCRCGSLVGHRHLLLMVMVIKGLRQVEDRPAGFNQSVASRSLETDLCCQEISQSGQCVTNQRCEDLIVALCMLDKTRCCARDKIIVQIFGLRVLYRHCCFIILSSCCSFILILSLDFLGKISLVQRANKALELLDRRG